MSVGIHSGTFHFFLVGDPDSTASCIVSGPAASQTATMEADRRRRGDRGQRRPPPRCSTHRAWVAPRVRRFCSGRAPDVPDGGHPRQPRTSRASTLAGVLPVAIREHLLPHPARRSTGPSRSRSSQFSGTDELLERRGPGGTGGRARRSAWRTSSRRRAAHGVTFFETDINRDGGKVMLTAGAPRSRGHDEERMLRAATLIIDRAGPAAAADRREPRAGLLR